MYNNNLRSYTINSKEYCYNVNKPSIYPTSMQVHIPALMPNIERGLPKSIPNLTVNSSMFANDKACRPSPRSVITTQNYVTITKWNNDHPAFPAKDDGSNRIIRYSQFLVDIFNGDIRNMHISRYIQ